MSLPLLRYTFSSNAVRLVFISAGLILMGVIMPVVFKAFGREIGEFVDTVPVLAQFSNFGGANLFSLTGIHPEPHKGLSRVSGKNVSDFL